MDEESDFVMVRRDVLKEYLERTGPNRKEKTLSDFWSSDYCRAYLIAMLGSPQPCLHPQYVVTEP